MDYHNVVLRAELMYNKRDYDDEGRPGSKGRCVRIRPARVLTRFLGYRVEQLDLLPYVIYQEFTFVEGEFVSKLLPKGKIVHGRVELPDFSGDCTEVYVHPRGVPRCV